MRKPVPSFRASNITLTIFFREGLRAFLAEDGLKGFDEAVVRATAWSCVHGLSFLLLGRRLPATPEHRDRMIEEVTMLFADLLRDRAGKGLS